MASGWAWGGSAPYKSTKLVAAHFGGTRNPLAVRWPAKIKHDLAPHSQFLHVNDVVPTIYEIVGITPPRIVNGFLQGPFDGVSFASTFSDAWCMGGGEVGSYWPVMLLTCTRRWAGKA